MQLIYGALVLVESSITMVASMYCFVVVLSDYYPNCEILFMSLANIHTIRKSFLALRTICAMSPDQPGCVFFVPPFNEVYEMKLFLGAIFTFRVVAVRRLSGLQVCLLDCSSCLLKI